VPQLFCSFIACLSSGVFLSSRIAPGLDDLCQNNQVDTTSMLNIEQRLDITHYAQDIRRYLAYEQIVRIFREH
jgi:hypothetical protein